MRKIFVLLALMMIVVGCNAGDDESIHTSGGDELIDYTSQITVTYFTGTSLKSYFNTNISDAKLAIESGVLGEGGRYIYCLPSSGSTASLYEVELIDGKCVETLIKEYKSFSSLAAGSFSMVMEDVKSYVDFDMEVGGEPQRMNLVVSGHGTGWISYVYGALSGVAGIDFTSEWEPENPLHPTRYMGSSSDGYMNIDTFANELEESGVKFGYILFDECFMSSVELLYQIRDYTDYVIASPCEILAAGFPYEEVMPYMFTNGGQDYDLQGICEAYYNYYSSSTLPCGCVAVCVTSELEALAEVQSVLSLRELTSSELSSLQAYEGKTSDHLFFDLKQYVNLAADEQAQSDLLSAYNTQYDKTFPEACRLNTNYFYTNIGSSKGMTIVNYYSGVTTSAPTTSKYAAIWEDEPWAVATTQSQE